MYCVDNKISFLSPTHYGYKRFDFLFSEESKYLMIVSLNSGGTKCDNTAPACTLIWNHETIHNGTNHAVMSILYPTRHQCKHCKHTYCNRIENIYLHMTASI